MKKWTMLAIAGAIAVTATAMPALAVTVVSGSGTITATDSTQTNRVARNSFSSTWSNTKNFPGIITQSPTYYDLINGAFASNAVQAIYYEIGYSSTSTLNLPFSVAYTDSFNPANLATNYIGDAGSSPVASSTLTYQVVVAAGHQLLLNFQNVPGVPVDYSYTVSAFSDANRGENFLPAAAAVPEPATWGMMILGMGLIGGAMRRKKVRTAVSFA